MEIANQVMPQTPPPASQPRGLPRQWNARVCSAAAALVLPAVVFALFVPFMYFSGQSGGGDPLVKLSFRATRINADVAKSASRVTALHREIIASDLTIKSARMDSYGVGGGKFAKKMRNRIASKSVHVVPSEFAASVLKARQSAMVLMGKSHSMQLRIDRLQRAQKRKMHRSERSRQDAQRAFGQRRRFTDPSRRKYFGRYQPDPRIETKMRFYKPTGDRNFTMSVESLRPLARSARKSKGSLLSYSNAYAVPNAATTGDATTVTTSGTLFVYNHTLQNRSECDVHYISLKYSRRCGDAELVASDVKPVLVVSVQRSGSHFTWEMLNRLGVKVHHEGVGPDGAVGWIYAVNALSTVGKSRSAGRPPGRGRRPALALSGGSGSGSGGGFAGLFGSRLQANSETAATPPPSLTPALEPPFPESEFGVGKHAGRGYVINNPVRLSRQRFVRVFHQVRHPLRVISTLLVRCESWDRYWAWIATVRGCEDITSSTSALRRAMLLYIVWNRHIEHYADVRFRTEVTSTRDVCTWAGFNSSVCSSPGPAEGIGIVEPEPWALKSALAASDSEAAGAERRRLFGRRQAAKGQSQSQSQREAEEAEGGGEEEDVEVDPEEEEQEQDQVEAVDLDLELELEQAHEEPIDPALHVTWDDLAAESHELANEVKIMCLEYGYPLDANLLPQSKASRKFSA